MYTSFLIYVVKSMLLALACRLGLPLATCLRQFFLSLRPDLSLSVTWLPVLERPTLFNQPLLMDIYIVSRF